MFRFFRYIALLVGIAAALPAAADKELSPAEQRKFDYYFYEGLKLKQDGKYDAAYDLFNYCLEIDSTAAPVLYELSSFYVQMNKADRAVEMLRRAAQDEPENFTYQMALANVSRNLGMFTEAAEQYEKLAQNIPTSRSFTTTSASRARRRVSWARPSKPTTRWRISWA